MDKNSAIFSLASESEIIDCGRMFIPSGRLLLHNKDVGCLIGAISSEKHRFEIGLAVTVGDWTFGIERYKGHSQDDWTVTAFFGQQHFTFDREVTNNPASMHTDFLGYVVRTFLTILCPDGFEKWEWVENQAGAGVAVAYHVELFAK